MWKFWMNSEEKGRNIGEVDSTQGIDAPQRLSADQNEDSDDFSGAVAGEVNPSASADATAVEVAPIQEAVGEEPIEVEECEDDDESTDEVSSNQGENVVDDPMGEAYCLDDGSPILDGTEEVLPWRSDVKSPREFFSTEILYRYDILDPGDQQALKGAYRLELKGHDGGTWTIVVDDELRVENARDDVDIVISMYGKDFMNLINGRLNPQLAILAQRIRVRGDTRRAVIFQSLLTPTPE